MRSACTTAASAVGGGPESAAALHAVINLQNNPAQVESRPAETRLFPAVQASFAISEKADIAAWPGAAKSGS
jgi:hypothetical protein